jgi:hypothetical protein
MFMNHTSTSWVSGETGQSGALGSNGIFPPKMEFVRFLFDGASTSDIEVGFCGVI